MGAGRGMVFLTHMQGKPTSTACLEAFAPPLVKKEWIGIVYHYIFKSFFRYVIHVMIINKCISISIVGE